jgi:hypothetical protein
MNGLRVFPLSQVLLTISLEVTPYIGLPIVLGFSHLHYLLVSDGL